MLSRIKQNSILCLEAFIKWLIESLKIVIQETQISF